MCIKNFDRKLIVSNSCENVPPEDLSQLATWINVERNIVSKKH